MFLYNLTHHPLLPDERSIYCYTFKEFISEKYSSIELPLYRVGYFFVLIIIRTKKKYESKKITRLYKSETKE